MEIENEVSMDNERESFREDGMSESMFNANFQIFRTQYDDHPTVRGSESMEEQDFSPKTTYPEVKISFPFFYSEFPAFRSHLNYYKEFWKLYLENWMLISKVKSVAEENKKIQWKLNSYRHKKRYYRVSNILSTEPTQSYIDHLSKRKKRRTAAEIPKSHVVQCSFN